MIILVVFGLLGLGALGLLSGIQLLGFVLFFFGLAMWGVMDLRFGNEKEVMAQFLFGLFLIVLGIVFIF